jgi:acyl-CoA dehydrogenase
MPVQYRAPLRDMQFVLRELAGIDDLAKLPGYGEVGDVVDAILDEAATFASEVLDPLNQSGDQEGCTWNDGVVTTPKGFKQAYLQFAKAGWIGLPVPEQYGGQGLPQLLLGPTLEMWNGANVGFANGPLLNQGAIEALELCGTDEQKNLYIPKLVSGEWTGTMCLTEPQAGSDLAAVRAKAVPEGDHYKISGQKIFITFGEHDMAPNIMHLVLARLPDAPEGTKGISMFIVPKILVNSDGTLGERNDVYCPGIEHKLGINGNPTCTLNYGEKTGGAIGYLVGEANRGLEYMFIMMNAARFSVGVQGLAVADRAYHQAPRRAPHADDDEVSDRSDARARVRDRCLAGHRAQEPRRDRTQEAQGLRRADDPGRQGLVHGSLAGRVFAGRPGLRRHGVRRRNRHRPAISRRAHHDDLRRHDGHPGAGPRRA